MKYQRFYRMLPLISLLSLLSCEDFVQVDMPSTQLTAEAVFQSTATANAALANIYVGIRDLGPVSGSNVGISNLMGGYADELDYYGLTGTSPELFFTNSLIPSDGQVSSFWSVSYSQIYSANAILEGTDTFSPIPQTDKDRIRGEALFLRAWLHFYLAGLYGDIPYVTSTNYAVNSQISRLPLGSVYSRIVEDLEQSFSLLPDAQEPGRNKPNRWAAQALLAKVLLQSGAWAEASNAASAVLNNTAQFSLNLNLQQVFLNNSNETIWQLRPSTSGNNTLEGATFIFLNGPPANTALSTSLVDAFEAGDARLEHWTKSVTNGVQTWYHPYKYKQNGISSASTENSIMMRLAEMYLIRAEARARQGELGGAKSDIDIIRSRASLPPTDATTQPELLNAILQERRFELFTELGHRFFDLKRFGQANTVLVATKPNWDPTDILLPLPEAELLRNPNLGSQNPGY